MESAGSAAEMSLDTGEARLEQVDGEFAAIYREHSRSIYYLALRFLGDEAIAEDAAHDVFLKAFKNYGRFRRQSSVRTWLYRITLNHCKNLQQSWYRRHMVNGVEEVPVDASPSRDESPFRVLELKELSSKIQRALDAMPEEYRLLLLLVADDELSYQEVADLTEQSVDAVRGKLHRARRAFLLRFRSTY